MNQERPRPGRPRVEDGYERRTGEDFGDLLRRLEGQKSFREVAAMLDCTEYALRGACKRKGIRISPTFSVSSEASK
jgi:hypothetical protein